VSDDRETDYFDPAAAVGEKKDHPETDSSALPPGRYMLAMAYFANEKLKGKDNRPFRRCKFEVIAGPGKGRTPWWNLELGKHPQDRKRLMYYCQAVGNMEAFDLRDPRAIAKRFKFKPFVAQLRVDAWKGRDGMVKSNEVARYYPPEEWTDDERRMIAAWREEQAANGYSSDSGAGSTSGDDMGGPVGGARDIPQDDDMGAPPPYEAGGEGDADGGTGPTRCGVCGNPAHELDGSVCPGPSDLFTDSMGPGKGDDDIPW